MSRIYVDETTLHSHWQRGPGKLGGHAGCLTRPVPGGWHNALSRGPPQPKPFRKWKQNEMQREQLQQGLQACKPGREGEVGGKPGRTWVAAQ